MMGYDFDRQRPIGNYIVDFYCKDLQLALEVDGITHEDNNAIFKDKIRQNETELLGVIFLRFDALLIVNKVESVVREIERWILTCEEKNGVPEFVKQRRSKKDPPQFLKEDSDSTSPLPGGDGSPKENDMGISTENSIPSRRGC